jgi:hypothetical protein
MAEGGEGAILPSFTLGILRITVKSSTRYWPNRRALGRHHGWPERAERTIDDFLADHLHGFGPNKADHAARMRGRSRSLRRTTVSQLSSIPIMRR